MENVKIDGDDMDHGMVRTKIDGRDVFIFSPSSSMEKDWRVEREETIKSLSDGGRLTYWEFIKLLWKIFFAPVKQ